ncbi:MAG: MBL fold metallo-hydrolase [Spirochaetaceae bacterium]|jgi:glyoxylase-like metal-dependent hydrolase (beta-lactamase superfamily II)|nr:MBL fold metallo-hydrolase [Spirochaetaceae bacterium]
MSEKVIVGALETNCWIVPVGGEPADASSAAVIDPGADAELIIACLERLKLYPKYILLTHGHFDHIAALPALYKRYSGGGRTPLIAIGKDDLMYVGPDSLAAHRASFTAAAGDSDYVDQLWEPMPDAGRVLKDGDTIGMFTVLCLPGHTKGSIAFFDEKGGRLYAGDTLFRYGSGRTDLPGGDAGEMRASLDRLFKMDGDIDVYPGHGQATTIGREALFFRKGV